MADKLDRFRKGIFGTSTNALVRQPPGRIPGSPDGPAPSRESEPGRPSSSEVRAWVSAAAAQTPAEARIRNVTAALLLDATGSMAGLIDDAKRELGTIVSRVSDLSGGAVSLQVIVYRDYCDGKDRLLEESALTTDASAIAGWLQGIRAEGGGDTPEAVEHALARVRDKRLFQVVLLAGDAPSHTRDELDRTDRRNQRTAREVADELGRRRIPVHTFLVGSSRAAEIDFAEIARRTGGKTGRLDGSESMRDMAVMAILHRSGGAAAVRRYAARYALGANARTYAALLTAGSEK